MYVCCTLFRVRKHVLISYYIGFCPRFYRPGCSSTVCTPKSKTTNHLKVHLSKVVVPYHKMSHSWTSSSSQCQVTSSRNAFHWRLWRRHKILTLLTRGCCYCCCLRRDSPETKAKAGGGVMAAAAAAAASTCTYTRLALLPWRCCCYRSERLGI